MTRKQKWLIGGVVGLAVVALAAAVIYRSMGPETDFHPASPTGLGAPETFGKVDFKKNIFLQHGAISIDDGPLKAIACGAGDEVFATVKIDDQLEGDLSCVDDYLGGVKITFTVDGEVRTAGVAQRDSDGGDDWDARSYLLRGKNGQLIIQTKTASSGQEIDEDGPSPMECSMSVSAQIWDGQSKNFIPGPPAEDAPDFVFRPPINVATECLNQDGSWKGR